jgi:(E)-benzylidenesuccinyl-CoA hydratase
MPITRSLENRIATVTLDRPEKLNALDPAHLRDLRNHLVELSADPGVSVVILTGAGQKSFCVGADLTAGGAPEMGVAEAFGLDLDQSAARGLYIRLFDLSGLQLRKPVIAAVNGFCLGGGLELALQCDLVVASEGSVFGLPEVAVASLPGAGGIPNLLSAVPRSIAMRMLLTGERIDALRAQQIGLVSDVWPADRLVQETVTLATRIAANGPLAVQLIKMLALQSPGMGRAQAFQMSELAWGLLRDTADRSEGRRAFAEKRKPSYAGR